MEKSLLKYKCGVRKNRQLALKYLHKSAELGYPQARKVLKRLEAGK